MFCSIGILWCEQWKHLQTKLLGIVQPFCAGDMKPRQRKIVSNTSQSMTACAGRESAGRRGPRQCAEPVCASSIRCTRNFQKRGYLRWHRGDYGRAPSGRQAALERGLPNTAVASAFGACIPRSEADLLGDASSAVLPSEDTFLGVQGEDNSL